MSDYITRDELRRALEAIDASAAADDREAIQRDDVLAALDVLTEPAASAETAAATPSVIRFVNNGDGTITDNATGLVWEAVSRGPMPWREAMDSCAALHLAGHADWRLPTIEELLTLVDYERHNPACDPVLEMRSYNYWSSSTYQVNPSYAWVVDFDSPGTDDDNKASSYAVRAVRAGSRPFGDSTGDRVLP